MAAIGAARRDLGLVTRGALISALEAQRNSRPAPTEASTKTDQVDNEVVAERIQQQLNTQQRVEVPHGSRARDPIGFSWKGTGSGGQKSEEFLS